MVFWSLIHIRNLGEVCRTDWNSVQEADSHVSIWAFPLWSSKLRTPDRFESFRSRIEWFSGFSIHIRVLGEVCRSDWNFKSGETLTHMSIPGTVNSSPKEILLVLSDVVSKESRVWIAESENFRRGVDDTKPSVWEKIHAARRSVRSSWPASRWSL